MRRTSDFSSVVRSGSRVRRGTIVVHQLAGVSPSEEPVVGFVVSKAVGNSVVRHQVSRRLRAQVAAQIVVLPRRSGTVVRALPSAGQASSARLGADLAAALRNLAAPSRSRPAATATAENR